MIKAWLINKLTQLSAWIGMLTIMSAFILPRSWIVGLGIVLIFTDDRKLQEKIAKWSPSIRDALNHKKAA